MTKEATVAAAAAGEGCLGRSAEDEPVFVLVARDEFAPQTIRDWARRVRFHGAKEKADGAERVAAAMEEWQAFHGSKKPD